MSVKRGNLDLLSSYTYFVPGAAEIFIILGLFILGVVLGNLAGLLVMLLPGADMSLVNLVAYPVMFLPAMFYASSKSHRASYNSKGLRLDSRHFSPLGGGLCALLAVIMTVSMAFAADIFSHILPEPSERFRLAMETITEGKFVISFISACVFAPFFEEWLCRGMVLRGLLGRGMKPAWAIVISAVFFAAIHLNPWQAVPAFLIGTLIGWFYYRTGSLKLCMLMHFTNNFFALLMANMPSLDEADTFLDLMPAAIYWVLFASALIIIALGVLRLRRIEVPEGGSMERVNALFED